MPNKKPEDIELESKKRSEQIEDERKKLKLLNNNNQNENESKKNIASQNKTVENVKNKIPEDIPGQLCWLMESLILISHDFPKSTIKALLDNVRYTAAMVSTTDLSEQTIINYLVKELCSYWSDSIKNSMSFLCRKKRLTERDYQAFIIALNEEKTPSIEHAIGSILNTIQQKKIGQLDERIYQKIQISCNGINEAETLKKLSL